MGDKEIIKNDNFLTELIIQSIIEVQKTLGPGFLENIYRKALLIELGNRNIHAENEKEVNISYHNYLVGIHRLDILVENKVIIELKTVENSAHSGNLGFSGYTALTPYLSKIHRQSLTISLFIE